jgi:hypothetical protein
MRREKQRALQWKDQSLVLPEFRVTYGINIRVEAGNQFAAQSRNHGDGGRHKFSENLKQH